MNDRAPDYINRCISICMKGINLIHMKSNVRYTTSYGSVTRKMQVLHFSLSTAEMFKFVIVYHVVSLLDIKADICKIVS